MTWFFFSSFKLFLELEPQLRDIIHKFYESKYASCLKLLDEIKVRIIACFSFRLEYFTDRYFLPSVHSIDWHFLHFRETGTSIRISKREQNIQGFGPQLLQINKLFHAISQRPWMDFARSFAHPAVFNTGAPISFTDLTLGGSDAVSPYIGCGNPLEILNNPVLL